MTKGIFKFLSIGVVFLAFSGAQVAQADDNDVCYAQMSQMAKKTEELEKNKAIKVAAMYAGSVGGILVSYISRVQWQALEIDLAATRGPGGLASYRNALNDIENVLYKASRNYPLTEAEISARTETLTRITDQNLATKLKNGREILDFEMVEVKKASRAASLRASRLAKRASAASKWKTITRVSAATTAVFWAWILWDMFSSGSQPDHVHVANNPLMLFAMDPEEACKEIKKHPATVGKAVQTFINGSHNLYISLYNEMVSDARTTVNELKILESGVKAASDATRVSIPSLVGVIK